jgi:hypothetical protein
MKDLRKLRGLSDTCHRDPVNSSLSKASSLRAIAIVLCPLDRDQRLSWCHTGWRRGRRRFLCQLPLWFCIYNPQTRGCVFMGFAGVLPPPCT